MNMKILHVNLTYWYFVYYQHFLRVLSHFMNWTYRLPSSNSHTTPDTSASPRPLSRKINQNFNSTLLWLNQSFKPLIYLMHPNSIQIPLAVWVDRSTTQSQRTEEENSLKRNNMHYNIKMEWLAEFINNNTLNFLYWRKWRSCWSHWFEVGGKTSFWSISNAVC